MAIQSTCSLDEELARTILDRLRPLAPIINTSQGRLKLQFVAWIEDGTISVNVTAKQCEVRR